MSDAGYWALRFISGKYQGSELPLEPNREIVVGRGSNADIVLMEDMVSRKHATIVFAHGEVTLQDLGSTNGSFLNGEKVKRAALKDGDRVLIGTSILKVVHASSGAGAGAFQRGEPARASEMVSTLRPRSLNGDISEQGLPSILQLLGSSKHTGTLIVQGPRTGRVFFKDGQVTRAVVEGGQAPLSGKRAFFRIFTWTHGAFSVQQTADAHERELEEATEALVTDAMKHAEEAKRTCERLPPGAARFAVSRPLTSPLKDLSPKRLDTLQLLWNDGELESVLDRNPLVDLDTYRHLLFLLQKEYIVVAE